MINKRIHIRLTDDEMSFLNKCSQLFMCSMTSYIKERCVSEEMIVFGPEKLEDKMMNRLKDVSDSINELAREMNSTYLMLTEYARPDLVLEGNDFSIALDDLKDIRQEWKNLNIELREKNALAYIEKKESLGIEDNVINDDATASDRISKSHFNFRLSFELYELLKKISANENCTVTKYIRNRSTLSEYTKCSGVLQDAEFMKVINRTGTNLRQFKFTLNKISRYCQNYLNISASETNKDFGDLIEEYNLFYGEWMSFEGYCAETEKNFFFDRFKKRELIEDVEDILKKENYDYYQEIKNRENALF